MLKIRWSCDRLIFNMGIHIPGKDCLYIETGPWLPIEYHSQMAFTLLPVHRRVFSCLLHTKWITCLYMTGKLSRGWDNMAASLQATLSNTFLYARLKNGRIMLWQCPSVCPSVRPSVRVFRTFFQRALRYQFETWYMHSVGGTTYRVWVSSQLGHFDLVYSQK